ncbi:MAG: DUF697 domain-containing protein [Magnetococcales bacterium]|nr:DUF697 domain-containing protein [Magnetococcales bacterium]
MSRWVPPVELPPESFSPRQKPAAPPPAQLPVSPGQEEGCDEEDVHDTPAGPGPGKRGFGPGRWILFSLILLFIAVLVEDAVGFLAAQYRLHPSLGISFGLLLFVLTGALLTAVVREWRSLRSVRAQDELRLRLERLAREDAFGQARGVLEAAGERYRERPEMNNALLAYRAAFRDHLGDRELVTLFSDVAMRPLDQAALRVVGRHAAGAALSAVLSPVAMLDALLFLWRNLRMIHEIARIYGLRPGFAGSCVLVRQMAEGMVVVGATELLTHTAADLLGDTLAGAALASAGQAATNALFTARIGLRAINQCRPVPFPPSRLPGLREIRKELQGALPTHQ